MMSGNEWVPRSTQRNGSLRRVERSGYRCREQDENLRFVRESHASLSVEVQKRKRESSVLSSQLRLNLCLSRSQEGCTGLECVLQRLRYKLAGKAPTYPRQIVASTSKASTGVSEQTTAVRLETGLTWESWRWKWIVLYDNSSKYHGKWIRTQTGKPWHSFRTTLTRSYRHKAALQLKFYSRILLKWRDISAYSRRRIAWK